ncbi:hypothetical protein BDA96_08G088800 [Sorghum bicolor]|uniref:Uncharacterized protein n=2 Tax=Sorghum bicolor TaxID=4558 RepID=A0A1B6PCC5_SORBI|nr:hypothetical protein BDA96_08G088800 [Sorghum bicolor]KXG23313.1 hypothetical protein SORBI_3008G082600 [Sorghum bicolor]
MLYRVCEVIRWCYLIFSVWLLKVCMRWQTSCSPVRWRTSRLPAVVGLGPWWSTAGMERNRCAAVDYVGQSPG